MPNMPRDPESWAGRVAAIALAVVAASGRTDTDLAAHIGVDTADLRQSLEGARPFPADELIALADALGVAASTWLRTPEAVLA